MSKRPIKRMRSTTNTWAIETTLPERPYFFVGDRLGTYQTRRSARESLAVLKSSYVLPMASRAVRVAVTVTTIGRG